MFSGLPGEDFEVLPDLLRKRGAHRAGSSSKFLHVFLVLFGVCVLGLGIFVFTSFFPNRSVDNNAGVVATSSGPVLTQAPVEPEVSEPVVPVPVEPAPVVSEPAPVVSSVPPRSGVVDKSVSLQVFNGTGVTGLAASVKQNLVTLGWDVSFVGNYDYYPAPPTTVYYARPGLRDTALAVLSSLGFVGGVAQESQAFSGDLSLVLGNDYR